MGHKEIPVTDLAKVMLDVLPSVARLRRSAFRLGWVRKRKLVGRRNWRLGLGLERFVCKFIDGDLGPAGIAALSERDHGE